MPTQFLLSLPTCQPQARFCPRPMLYCSLQMHSLLTCPVVIVKWSLSLDQTPESPIPMNALMFCQQGPRDISSKCLNCIERLICFSTTHMLCLDAADRHRFQCTQYTAAFHVAAEQQCGETGGAVEGEPGPAEQAGGRIAAEPRGQGRLGECNPSSLSWFTSCYMSSKG